MALTVTCSDPLCGAQVEVADEMAGQTVLCSECGAAITVPGDPATDDDLSAPDAGERDFIHHPARQQCSNCGAVLGVRDAVCKECGADVRTGTAVQAATVKKKINFAPFLIGGGILVALAVLVGLVVVAAGMLMKRKGKADEEQPPAAEPQAVVRQAAAQEQDQEVAKVQVSEDQLGDLAQQELVIGQAVAEFREKLAQVLGETRSVGSDEAARLWAELATYCQDVGLPADAEMCWYRAVQLRPTDPSVNAALGRTETYGGVPVTPEQKAFLDEVRPVLRFVNRDAGLDAHVVSIEGAGEANLDWSSPAELRPSPGPVRVDVTPVGGEAPLFSLQLDVQTGLEYALELRKAAAAPALGFDDLASIYNVVTEGVGDTEVRVVRDWQGQVSLAETGSVQVKGPADGGLAMQLGRGGGELIITGSVAAGNAFADAGQQVYYGDRENPLRLVINAETRTVTLRRGTYFVLRTDLCDALWGALATAEGDFGSEWARGRLSTYLAQVEFDGRALEARGELVGAWQANGRLYRLMTARRRKLEMRLDRQTQASQKPDHLDRARNLNVPDRADSLYLNWPRFRRAWAALTEECHPAMLAQLALMQGGEDQAAAAAGRGGRRGQGPRGRGVGRDGPSFGRQAPTTSTAASLHEPAEVALGPQALLYARAMMLPLLPDRVALSEVKANWPSMNRDAKMAAMMSLEKVATPEVVSFLGSRSEEEADTEIVVGALLALGAIGTQEALQYTESPAFVPEVRMAALAAKAIAGDPDVLGDLDKALKDEDAKSKGLFLQYVADADTPGALLMLTAAAARPEGANQALIARSLARIGGHTALWELAAMMKTNNTLYADALEKISADESVTVLRVVGDLASKGKGGLAAVELLRRDGSETALVYLRAAVANNPTPDALLLLLRGGSALDIGIAGNGIRGVDLDLLKTVRKRWYTVEGREWAWNGPIDSRAARAFLAAVHTGSPQPKVKLAAAMMLREIGEDPDRNVLLALAEEPAQELKPEDTAVDRRKVRSDVGRYRGMGGPSRASATVAQYDPPGFIDPSGLAQLPSGFELELDRQFYAMGLLQERTEPEASEGLRELVDAYRDIRLRTAGMRVLGQIGLPENMQYLRDNALTHKSSYAKPAELMSELQNRLAALKALGAAQDVEFLPQLLELLSEEAPAKGAVAGLKGEYDDFSGWYLTKLWGGAAAALADVCRHEQLFELTADSDLREQVGVRLVAIMEWPGPERPALTGARQLLRAEAIRAFGRCASSHDEESRLVLRRFAMTVAEPATDESASDLSRRPGMDPSGYGRRPDRRRGSRGRKKQSDPIVIVRGALQDAVAHLAVRGGGGLALLREVPGILPAPDEPHVRWSALLQEMAETPNPEFFAVTNEVFSSVETPARYRILALSKGAMPAYDSAYAQFVAKMVRLGPEPEEDGSGSATRRQIGMRPGGMPVDMPPEVLAMLQSMGEFGPGGPGGPGAAPGTKAKEGPGFTRRGPRRMQKWSYGLSELGAATTQAREQWAMTDELFRSSASALATAFREEGLASVSQFGPAIAVRCVKDAPSVRDEAARQLSDVLIGVVAEKAIQGPGPGFRGAGPTGLLPGTRRVRADGRTRRAAVAALRRIGGDEAVDTIYTALVGVRTDELNPAAGAARGGPMGPPPGAMMDRRGSRPAVPMAAELPLAPYAARALGSMGRADLLRAALNASDRANFSVNATEVQMAALAGMAHLPAGQNPLGVLQELLRLANTAELQRAVAAALVDALKMPAA